MLTFTQLLKASADGLPLVKSDTYIKGATSNVGQVVMLKDNGNWKGCSVRFPGLDYHLGSDRKGLLILLVSLLRMLILSFCLLSWFIGFIS